MSAAMKTSLTKLDQAVNKLESVIEARVKAAQKGEGQTDLFGAMSSGRKSNDNALKTKAMADKLDSAISKIEKILQEG